MKTIMYLFLVVILVIAGCSKDDTLYENPNNPELKKAKVPIPFKADCYALPDMESDPILISGLDPSNPNNYFASRLIVSGTATHIGKIDAEKSFYQFESVEFIMEEGIPMMKQEGVGKMIGANGDGIEFRFWGKQSLLDGSFSSGANIKPGTGTGKFNGCTGSLDTFGGYHPDGIGLWFKTEGSLVFE